MASNKAIGIFDSGVGGFTVMREFMKELPNENLIYFGDTKRVPYGNKSKDTITKYALQIVDFLESKNVKMIVIACNTVTALAFDELKKYTNIPLIEVITPGSINASEQTVNKRIGVIATQATVKSEEYINKIKNINNTINVFQKECPEFVSLIEKGDIDTEYTKQICNEYLDVLLKENIDTLVLGCTHYPLLRETIENICKDIKIIDPAINTCKTASSYLKEHNLLSDDKNTSYSLYTSSYGESFNDVCKIALGKYFSYQLIETMEQIDIEHLYKQ